MNKWMGVVKLYSFASAYKLVEKYQQRSPLVAPLHLVKRLLHLSGLMFIAMQTFALGTCIIKAENNL